MRTASRDRGRVRRTALLVGAAAAVIGGSLAAAPVGAGGATAAPAGPGRGCPAAYPLSQVRAGMHATGLTTHRGSTPSRFSVTVLGVLRDGVAPGVDMVLIKATSRAITAAGGVWQGMSGSPIYAKDGRLIGALAYGLSFGPSRTAGVTPVGAMYDVLGFGRSAATGLAPRVSLTPALQQAVVRSGAASASRAAGGLAPLATPVAVSGVNGRQLDRLRESAGDGFTFYRGGSASAAPADTSRIRPGAPFAVAVSYGAFTYAGVGTVTAVCGGQVLAFGHPMMAFGRTTESAHVAKVMYVEKETLGAPFAVANVGGLVGTVTQDRLAGIRARLGHPHEATTVVADVTASTGLHRVGRTRAPVTAWLPEAAANAAYGQLWATLQMDGGGRAFLHWTVRGHRANGKPWDYTRNDRTSVDYSIAYSVGDLIYYPLWSIVANPFEKVSVDRVAIEVAAWDSIREFRMTALRVLVDGHYVEVTPDLVVTAEPGQSIQVRARLAPYRGIGRARTVDLTVRVPAGAAPGIGQLVVTGGADYGFGPEGAEGVTAEPKSFDDVLAALRAAPHNDVVYADLSLPDELGNPVLVKQVRQKMPQVVRGSFSVQVEVPGTEPPPDGEPPAG